MISVIIPLYNKGNSISNTIQSVLRQSIKDFEILIVDDGSTDNSANVVSTFGDRRVKLIKQDNGGPSKARNTGIDNAQGEWIIFLDADDELLPDAFNTFYDILKKYTQCKCFAFNFFISHNGLQKCFYKIPGTYVVNNPLKGWCKRFLFPRAGAAFFHNSIVKKCKYDESLRRYEDAEWLLNIMRDETFVRCDKVIMVYNTDSAEASKPRSNIQEDFLGNLDFRGKGIWEQVALYQLLKEVFMLYPQEAKDIYETNCLSIGRLFMIKLLCFYCKLYILVIAVCFRFLNVVKVNLCRL